MSEEDLERDQFEEAFGGLPDCLERHDGYSDTVAAYWIKKDVEDRYEYEDDQIRFCSGWDGWKARENLLKKDADRYRFLRDKAEASDWEYLGYQMPEETDKEVDALMNKEAS